MPGAWTTVYRAASDRNSGASQIASAASSAIASLDAEEARKAVELLVTGHPTMAPLWRLASEVLDGPTPAEAAKRFDLAMASDDAAADVLSGVLTPWVLTISYSTSVLRALRTSRRLSMVTCMESVPGREGRRFAEAVSEFARSRVVTDTEALAKVPGGVVAVGCDALTPTSVVNKTKTRSLAEAAGAHNIPVYAVAGWSKFVGEQIPVELPFQAVPVELFTGIATPDGLLSPGEAGRRAESQPLNDALQPLLHRVRRRQ
jgi:translation initiation factor 2B subunit (eIF-2B alpha/beta/delta family)